jgi:hypothetical protein
MLLLKAVATALVLIAGAAVVLWYANTLNSWVLGGLIGGLAALLLSIPISLTLFSYLSHRYDGHSRVEEDKHQEAMSLSYDYEEVSERALRKISIEEENEYLHYQRGVWGEEYEEEHDNHYLPDSSRRQLPAPRVPNSNQQPVYRSPSTQHSARETRQLSARDTEMGSQHTASRRPHNPDFPGYQPEMTRGQFQSQALRIAREEAYLRSEKAEATDDFRTHRSRRPSSPLRTKKLDTTWKEKPLTPYSYRQDPEDLLDDHEAYPSTQPRYLRRGRRVVDANLSPNSPYRQSPDSTGDQAQQIDSSRDSEAEDFDQTYSTGNLKKPLVRRAPYMYDTDALKSELSQQVDPPITRRSSRNLFVRHDDE